VLVLCVEQGFRNAVDGEAMIMRFRDDKMDTVDPSQSDDDDEVRHGPRTIGPPGRFGAARLSSIMSLWKRTLFVSSSSVHAQGAGGSPQASCQGQGENGAQGPEHAVSQGKAEARGKCSPMGRTLLFDSQSSYGAEPTGL
jgi:hypothetical protein